MTLGFVLSLAPVATAEHYEGTVELAGATPVEAAISLSKLAFPGGAPQAVLGRDDAFADSLASGILQTTSPLLLTSTATLSPAVESELKRLGAKTVHILGGPSAVSPAVEQQLVAAGYAVRRHRGPTRIDTAVEIARAIAPSASEVLIARAFGGGDDPTQAFADSLAAGAWSASSGNPVLLTESEKLSAPTQTYLAGAKPGRAYVIGGASAVSEAVVTQLRALGIQVERVSGATRFDTAVEIAKRRGIDGAADANDIVLLEGQAAGAWAPGFAAAAYAAVERAPVLLASGNTLPPATATFLDGGDAALGLLCAPQLAEAACTAAAQALEKRAAPKVTLNEASVAQYANVTGTVTPAEQVLSVVASGCGLIEREVVVNQDGSFATRIEGPPGTCTIEFEVETRDQGTFTKTFSLTVTEAAPATNWPELVKVETVSTGAQVATVRFVFSEIVRATFYDGAAATTFDDKFLLYGARGTGGPTNQKFKSLDGAVESGETVADPGAPPRRDPTNNRAVLVDFRRADYDLATVAAVQAAAAEDLGEGQGTLPAKSIPGSAPLKAYTFPAGRTDGEDLESVGSITSQGMGPGKFRATFTFDDPFDTGEDIAADAFGVVLADGRIIRGESESESGRTYSVVFNVAATEDPDGTVCVETACPTVQQAMSGVRRGYVADDARPLQAAEVVAEGLTDGPDLVDVEFDFTEGTADFTFDEPVDEPDASQFFLYLVENNEVLPVDAVEVISEKVVRVTAPISPLVVGASVGPGAVTGEGMQSAPASVGIAQTFEAGQTVSPLLIGGIAEFVGADAQDDHTWRITWVFDLEISEFDPSRLFVYTIRPNGETVAHSSTSVERLEECQFELIFVTCDVTFDGGAERTPVLATATPGAVTSVGAVPDTELVNIEGSVRL